MQCTSYKENQLNSSLNKEDNVPKPCLEEVTFSLLLSTSEVYQRYLCITDCVEQKSNNLKDYVIDFFTHDHPEKL